MIVLLPAFSLFFFLTGCKEEISSGDKRLKLEFLYKLNNSASIIRDYTAGVTDYRNLSLYEGRVSSVERMIETAEAPAGWTEGQDLKKDLQEVIRNNKQSANRLLTLWKDGDKSPVEVDATAGEMMDRITTYLEKINKVTSSVDLE